MVDITLQDRLGQPFSTGGHEQSLHRGLCLKLRLAVSKTEPNIKDLLRRAQELVSHCNSLIIERKYVRTKSTFFIEG